MGGGGGGALFLQEIAVDAELAIDGVESGTLVLESPAGKVCVGE